jgi:hypothetical protein
MKLKCKNCDYQVAKITPQGFLMVKHKEMHAIVNGKDYNVALKCQRCGNSTFIEFDGKKWLNVDDFNVEKEDEIETPPLESTKKDIKNEDEKSDEIVKKDDQVNEN